MFRYLKAAFLVSPSIRGLGKLPVNVLALIGVLALGMANPGFWLMGLGLEVLFLFSLATNPRFQNYVRAVEASAGRGEKAVSADETAKKILSTLPERLVQRFEQLKARCEELRQIAMDMKGPQDPGGTPPLDELHLEGLDRLLWIHLRLLFTQYSLERFLQKTSEGQIQADIEGQQKRLAAIPAGDLPQSQKMRKALEDNLETSKARLANFLKAKENYELVNLEVERLENKISSLSELGVNRHEPQFISGQIDQVATSVVQTERTITELEFVTGLSSSDAGVPGILRRKAVQTED